MSFTPAQLRVMAEKGLSAFDIADIADAGSVKSDDAADRRRAADRDRKARKRLADKSAENTADTDGKPHADNSAELPPSRTREIEKTNQDSSPLPSGTPKGVPSVRPPNGGSSANRGHRLPDDFVPDEATIAAGEKDGHSRAHIFGRGLDEFRDYWRGVPGAKGRKLDWQGTYRNSLRKTAPGAHGARAGPPRFGNRNNALDFFRKKPDDQFGNHFHETCSEASAAFTIDGELAGEEGQGFEGGYGQAMGHFAKDGPDDG